MDVAAVGAGAAAAGGSKKGRKELGGDKPL